MPGILDILGAFKPGQSDPTQLPQLLAQLGLQRPGPTTPGFNPNAPTMTPQAQQGQNPLQDGRVFSGLSGPSATGSPQPQQAQAQQVDPFDQEIAKINAQREQLLKQSQIETSQEFLQDKFMKEVGDFDTFANNRFEQQYGTGGSKTKSVMRFLTDVLRTKATGMGLRDSVREAARTDWETAQKNFQQKQAAAQQARQMQIQTLNQQANDLKLQQQERRNDEIARHNRAMEEARMSGELASDPQMILVNDKAVYARFNKRTGDFIGPDGKVINPLEITDLQIPKPAPAEKLSDFEQELETYMKAHNLDSDNATDRWAAYVAVKKVNAESVRNPILDEYRRLLTERELNRQSASSEDISTAANLVVSGQATLPSMISALGGVQSGKGPELLKAIAASGNLIVDPKARDAMNGVNVGMARLNSVERLVDSIVSAKNETERLEQTLLLEGLANEISASLARANGEVGVLTDRDVGRATSLLPGWKAANFNPDYAKKELKLLREHYNAVLTALTQKYFTLNRQGALNQVNQTQTTPNTGRKMTADEYMQQIK